MYVVQGTPFRMLRPPPNCCPVCAAPAHADDFPHNRDSLFYQWWFSQTYGRPPTWADAALLCPDEMKANLKTFLVEHNVPPEKIGDL